MHQGPTVSYKFLRWRTVRDPSSGPAIYEARGKPQIYSGLDSVRFLLGAERFLCLYQFRNNDPLLGHDSRLKPDVSVFAKVRRSNKDFDEEQKFMFEVKLVRTDMN